MSRSGKVFVREDDASELTGPCYLLKMRSWLIKTIRSLKGRPTISAPTRFVVLFPGRTGSSHLVSCLSQHHEIFVEGEKLVRLDLAAQREYLRGLYGDEPRNHVRAVGFKTKLKDIASLEEFASTLIAHDVRIITLLRENRVKLAVSTLNARRIHALHGRWNLVGGEPQLPPLDATVDEIVSMIERVESSQRDVMTFASRLPLPRLEITYETMLASHDATMKQVQEFLQVDPRPLVGSVAKATHDDLRRSVVHFEALAERLRDTEYDSEVSGR